jgi:hypothetical protein
MALTEDLHPANGADAGVGSLRNRSRHLNRAPVRVRLVDTVRPSWFSEPHRVEVRGIGA